MTLDLKASERSAVDKLRSALRLLSAAQHAGERWFLRFPRSLSLWLPSRGEMTRDERVSLDSAADARRETEAFLSLSSLSLSLSLHVSHSCRRSGCPTAWLQRFRAPCRLCLLAGKRFRPIGKFQLLFYCSSFTFPHTWQTPQGSS